MPGFEPLIELEHIKRLKYRYMRALDTQNWDLMADCFTADVSCWYSGGALSTSGRDNVVGMLKEYCPPGFVSSHIAVHPEIDLLDDTRAEGVWRMEDLVNYTSPTGYRAGGTGEKITGGERMQGAGYYYDSYSKTEDRWQISRTGFIRLFELIDWPDDRKPNLFVPPNRGVRAADT